MKYYCCDPRRREVVKLNGTLNGLEYLEVHDSGIPGDPTRQLTLFLKFLRAVPASLDKNNFYIEGGERIKSVDLAWVAIANALPAGEPPGLVDGFVPLDQFMVIRTKIYGDFFGTQDIQDIEKLLVGKKHDREIIQAELEKIDIERYFHKMKVEDILSVLF